MTGEEEKRCNEFRRKMDELRDIISDGIAHLYAWRGLMIEDEEDARALNRYRGFFLPAQVALRSAALMQFAKVFDKNPKTVSLRNLLRDAKAHRSLLAPHVTEKELEEIEAQVKADEGMLDSLKHLRDTRLAHHDSNVLDNEPLTYGKVLQLVEDTKSMYNSLRKGHDRNFTSFERLSDDAETHTTRVVRIMREERDRASQRLREELSKFTAH